MKKSFCLLSLAALVWAGCGTPVAVQTQYSTTNGTISGDFQTGTNSFSAGADFSSGGTNLSGAVSVGK